ncbi:Putative ribonuclease H protein At1g65750 [Linum perenne]
MSGQRVNLDKSAVRFSHNTPTLTQGHYRNILGVRILEPTEKYLGLPCIILRSKQETFRFIEDQVTLRLRSWKRDSLSPAGAYTLLQSVISGLPVYAMSCFELSAEVCKTLNKLMAKFWWGQISDDRRVLKSVYFPNTSFLLSNGRGRPSWGWQSLILGRDLLLPGIRWQIGTGVQVDSTQDLWLPGSVPQRPQLRFAGIFLGPSSVAGFISQGRWNVSLLRYWFTDDSVRLIQSIPLPRHPQPDRRVWHHSPSGTYSASSGYEFVMRSRPDLFSMNLSPMESSIWLSVWSLQIQPKLRFFLWKILHRILPTMHGIKIRIQSETLDSMCLVCFEGPETIEHLLLHCRISQCFLRMCSLHPPNFGDTHISIYWKHLLAFQPQLQQVWVMAWWRIWKSRNRVVFEFAQTRLEVLFQQFHSQWREHTQVYGPSSIPPPLHSLPPLPTWSPPHSQRLKINVDGATLPGVGGASGWVLRNSSGTVLRAVGTTYPGIEAPFLLELLAVRDACFWCWGSGVLQVDIEGDAELVTTRLLAGAVMANPGGAIVEEILQFKSTAPSWRFQTVRRSGNRVAHYVARMTLNNLPGVMEVDMTAWVGT